MPAKGTVSIAPSGESGADTLDALRSAGTLVLLVRGLEQDLRGAASADALGLTELGVMGQIDRGKNLPSLLARALRLDPARVTHISDRLVAQHYLVRMADPTDRRRWRLVLTERGKARLQAGRVAVRAATEALLAQLTEQDRQALQQGLEAVREVLDAHQ